MSSNTSLLAERFSETDFGFLSIVELPGLGFCGGLLVVSSIGRPIEFHCTAPVKPNRTQEIMYGKTYRDYLFSDLLATALVEKLKSQPSIYLTDADEAFSLSNSVEPPVVLIKDGPTAVRASDQKLDSFQIQKHHCLTQHLDPAERNSLESLLQNFADKLPLDEPLERISQAIEEAHTVLRAG